MSVGFLKGIPIADLEMEMQRVPEFGPRRGGIIRSQYPANRQIDKCRDYKCTVAKRENGKRSHEFSYGILLQLLAEELPASSLAVRIGRLQMNDLECHARMFRNEEHKTDSWLSCAAYPGILTDSEFSATLYLLSSDSQIWKLVGPFVGEKVINCSMTICCA